MTTPFDTYPMNSCLSCILFHCNGDLPEEERHAALIIGGFEYEQEQTGGSVCANDLDDTPDFYGESCDFCGAGGATSPTALVILVRVKTAPIQHKDEG